jgi:uncharacterized membrane protein YqjE
MSEKSSPSASLFQSLRRFLKSVLGIARSRLELFAIELQEEKWRFQQLLIWSVVGVFAAVMTLSVVTATVVYLVGEEQRGYALGAFCIVYAGLGAFAFLRVRKVIQDHPPFEQSIKELKKDQAWLEKGK